MLPFSIDKNNTLRELRVDKNSHLSRRVHTPPNPSHIFFPKLLVQTSIHNHN